MVFNFKVYNYFRLKLLLYNMCIIYNNLKNIYIFLIYNDISINNISIFCIKNETFIFFIFYILVKLPP